MIFHYYVIVFLICMIDKNVDVSSFISRATNSFNIPSKDKLFSNHVEVETDKKSPLSINYIEKFPYFSNTTVREVIAAVGTTASFECRVRNLGDRAVSWIRKRDLHILTIDLHTYTNDQRFLAQHIIYTQPNSDLWILHILSVQSRDAGVYECQVSTDTKLSQSFKLHVVTSKARILATREIFIQSGNNINLTCIAPQAPGPYTHMVWYKDNELINDMPRGGIRIVSEQVIKTINLMISRALPEDSGNYTCGADSSNSDSVLVHIIQSEKHAAIQRESAIPLKSSISLLLGGSFMALYMLYCC